jgi:soluble epoxide hydrolase/lipid-phosphate phosphatase
MIIWRTVLWHPELISHVFSVCTPYDAPSKSFRSTQDLVNTVAPQFGYQLHLASGEVESRVNTPDLMRQFIKGMFNGRGPNREVIFSPSKGILFDNLAKVGAPKSMTSKVRLWIYGTRDANNLQEIDYYTDQYMLHGLHGPRKLMLCNLIGTDVPVNWYRTRKVNHEDDQKYVIPLSDSS